ncbi:hypothetical protein [Longimicrobium sp.]|uniref:hypothetical protein n=1 Tax=Longimicrobium sp. TaxID=2029185 RepID=UPI002E30B5C1|nr:hypothetical protein [Longimicrobium sp.]HEX6037314.1 hypothetical protein [Longimicrobium sp.]
MKHLVFAILAAAGLGACSPNAQVPAPQAPAASASLDQPFPLHVGSRATVAGADVTVRFESVASDSRCPTGVQCVWAGNAVVRAVLSQGNKAFGAELNTTLEPKSVRYLDYQVALVSLTPQPAQGSAIDPSRYEATFVVTRAAQ